MKSPATTINLYTKQFIYSDVLSECKVQQSIPIIQTELETMAETGFWPKKLKKKQLTSFIINYKYIERKYWPPELLKLKDLDFQQFEDEIESLNVGITEKYNKSILNLNRILNSIALHRSPNAKPKLAMLDMPQYSWVVVRANEKNKKCYYLGVFLKIVDRLKETMKVQWADKIVKKNIHYYYLMNRKNTISLQSVIVYDIEMIPENCKTNNCQKWYCSLTDQDYENMEKHDYFIKQKRSYNEDLSINKNNYSLTSQKNYNIMNKKEEIKKASEILEQMNYQ